MTCRILIALLAASLLLGGCSTIKKLTGQRDDTVLPGEREEVLTPDQYTAKGAEAESTSEPAQTAPAPEAAKPCNPDKDPKCVPPAEEGYGGVFNDG